MIIEQDLAQKYRVYPEVAGETIMLKFDHLPTDEEITYEANKYTENKTQIEANRVAEQIRSIEEQIAQLEKEMI